MSQVCFLNVNLPLKWDTSLYRTLHQVPKVSTIEVFHCIPIALWVFLEAFMDLYSSTLYVSMHTCISSSFTFSFTLYVLLVHTCNSITYHLHVRDIYSPRAVPQWLHNALRVCVENWALHHHSHVFSTHRNYDDIISNSCRFW